LKQGLVARAEFGDPQSDLGPDLGGHSPDHLPGRCSIQARQDEGDGPGLFPVESPHQPIGRKSTDLRNRVGGRRFGGRVGPSRGRYRTIGNPLKVKKLGERTIEFRTGRSFGRCGPEAGAKPLGRPRIQAGKN
jgi:hypothetical protein